MFYLLFKEGCLLVYKFNVQMLLGLSLKIFYIRLFTIFWVKQVSGKFVRLDLDPEEFVMGYESLFPFCWSMRCD